MKTKTFNQLKICVSSTGKTTDSQIDARFGRCQYFLIVDLAGQKITGLKAIINEGAGQEHGAGIRAAQQVGELGVSAVITGNLGPKAGGVLKQLGIKTYSASGTVREVVNQFAGGKLKTIGRSGPENIPLSGGGAGSVQAEERIFFPLLNSQGENSEISPHFGHAPFFGLYNATTRQLTIAKSQLDHADQNKSPVDQVIAAANPTTVFAQGMGERAIDLFADQGIALKTGSYRTVKEVIDHLDKLEDLTQDCKD